MSYSLSPGARSLLVVSFSRASRASVVDEGVEAVGWAAAAHVSLLRGLVVVVEGTPGAAHVSLLLLSGLSGLSGGSSEGSDPDRGGASSSVACSQRTGAHAQEQVEKRSKYIFEGG